MVSAFHKALKAWQKWQPPSLSGHPLWARHPESSLLAYRELTVRWVAWVLRP